jgi:hypothetical protein
MGDKEQQSLDILGIKPVGEAVNTAVGATVDGAQAFLSRICLPAAEEFGLLLRDRVSHWRANHAARIAEKAKNKLRETRGLEGMQAHPRLVAAVLDQGSWADSDQVQEMWAGLLASSCTEDGKDDSNLIFVNLMSQLTAAEAKFLDRLCEEIDKEVSPGGTIRAVPTYFTLHNIMDVFGIGELYRLHRELKHLSSLDLAHFHLPEVLDESALNPAAEKPVMVEGWPTPLALYMYVDRKSVV